MYLDNDAIGGGSAGNADLKPIHSTNFDANLEWYFAPRPSSHRRLPHGDGSYITNGSFTGTYPVLLGNTAGGSGAATGQSQVRHHRLTNKKAS